MEKQESLLVTCLRLRDAQECHLNFKEAGEFLEYLAPFEKRWLKAIDREVEREGNVKHNLTILKRMGVEIPPIHDVEQSLLQPVENWTLEKPATMGDLLTEQKKQTALLTQLVENTKSWNWEPEKYISPTTTESTGERIRKARIAAGLSQKQLAKIMGFETEMPVSMIENNKRVPKADVITRMSSALHIDVSKLIR